MPILGHTGISWRRMAAAEKPQFNCDYPEKASRGEDFSRFH